jgi:hypothetical protein
MESRTLVGWRAEDCLFAKIGSAQIISKDYHELGDEYPVEIIETELVEVVFQYCDKDKLKTNVL